MDLTRWFWSPQLIVRSLTTLSVRTLTHLSHPTAAVLEYRKNHPPPPSCEETIKTTMTNNSTKHEEEDKDLQLPVEFMDQWRYEQPES